MQVIAFDTETTLIRPANLAPSLVCLTWCVDGSEPQIVHRDDAEKVLERWFCGGHSLILGHNVAYDLAVVCEAFPKLTPGVFRAYREDRVTDTKIREQMLDIAAGKYRWHPTDDGGHVKVDYSLASVAPRRAGLFPKKDGFRLFYGLFALLPLNMWTSHAREVQRRARVVLAGGHDAEFAALQPYVDDWEKELKGLIAADPDEVVTYPLEDAVAPAAIYEAQEEHVDELDDQYRQARAAFWLHLSSAWGLRTTPDGVRQLRERTERAYAETQAALIEAELVRPNGVRNTKVTKRLMVEVCAREELPLRRTATHGKSPGKCKDINGVVLEDGADECAEHVCLDEVACTSTGDELLIKYAEASTLQKVLSNNIPALERGVYWPVHTSYGLADTGRTTSANPPIQNLTNLGGIRESFVPRPGHLFASCDFPQLELYTWAQCCLKRFGHSKLAAALNAGLDAHIWYGAVILGRSYEETLARYVAGEQEVADIRWVSKAGNFGWPGGMGVPKFTRHLRRTLPKAVVERLNIDEERVAEWRAQWFEAWPEAHDHFARVKALLDPVAKIGTVTTVFTNRVRGAVGYCQAANNDFQALGADCAKEAGWRIADKQYTNPSSALWNTRTVFFVHDEFGIECKDSPKAHDSAYELADTMREGANKYLPDVPIPAAKMAPVLMRQWSKKAKQVFSEGRLVPWQ
jgi:hypothetical protein